MGLLTGLMMQKGKIIIHKSPEEEVKFSFNPEKYTIRSKVQYSEDKGLSNETTKLSVLGNISRELSATLFFDSTVSTASLTALTEGMDAASDPVTDRTKKIAEALLIDGSQHKQPMVTFSWGNLNFKGYLTSLNEEYTMFSIEGKPIRAKLDITIQEDTSDLSAAKKSPFESPDRTKSRVITEGMSLWAIAEEEYGDCEKWRILAKANHMMNPLDLVPGQILKIPAL